MSFCIDTSSLLEAWQRAYPPDRFPGIWERIEKLIEEGQLVAPDEVLHELERKDDELLAWAKSKPKLFVPLDPFLQNAVTKILAKHAALVGSIPGRNQADPFVVALAQLRRLTVITEEIGTKGLGRPKIPDVCKAEGIECLRLVDAFRRLGWKF
jgi:uncharacterized protein DUF4411